jgi:membrane protein implicated in regulation of membrane protease activity
MLSAVLDLGIDLDVWPWIWLITAVVFALVELMVVGGSFIILPWAASAFVAAILAFYNVPIEIQWAVFVFGGAILFSFLYRWAQKFMKEHTMDPGVGADRLVGLTAIVTAPIIPDDTTRAGRVTIDGEVWGAVTDGTYRIDSGARVRVLAMKGTRVVVVPEAPTTRPTEPAPGGEEQT